MGSRLPALATAQVDMCTHAGTASRGVPTGAQLQAGAERGRVHEAHVAQRQALARAHQHQRQRLALGHLDIGPHSSTLSPQP